jgi:hypothetical protein
LEDPCVDGRIILKTGLQKRGCWDWIDLAQDRDECSNESSGPMKCEDLVD